ncbi:amidohydrolase family protein [Pseudonocardia kujensis]|uniref:amidohydrolase family protein n=1 Tax=Pseudonocardia kujensis TaxID=1128675 RepID=UPI001E620DD2|nr:amidohydrolase family protein [Pseudonocardia kujensis]MCE0768468.1 amidohydrolase family protein [Pseudonocardia kujensis]
MTTWAEELRLVDHHCHSVVGDELDEAAFGALLTEAPVPAHDPWDSMLGLAVRRECAPVLDLPRHAPPADYLARRRELGAAEATRRLLAATGTDALLVDHGLRASDLLGLDALSAAADTPVAEVVRLEAVAEDVVRSGVGPADYADALVEELARRTADAVACKSILAYRHGFDVPPHRPAPAEVTGAAAEWARTGGRLADPVLLRHALWCGVDRGLPLQLHTGFGDPDEDLHRANPVLLTAFCRATAGAGTPIVLLHCYPYHREAAWLAQVFPHVWFDLGLASTYVGHRAAEVLAEALELAPFGKLLYSSDAFGLAELYLVAARAFQRAVGRVLGGWVVEDEATEPDARRVAAMIAGGNARALYEL